MAKKATAEAVEVAPQEKVVTKVAAPVQPTKPTWEIKDRLYILKDNKRPIVFTLPAKHSNVKPLLWFDEKTGLKIHLLCQNKQERQY